MTVQFGATVHFHPFGPLTLDQTRVILFSAPPPPILSLPLSFLNRRLLVFQLTIRSPTRYKIMSMITFMSLKGDGPGDLGSRDKLKPFVSNQINRVSVRQSHSKQCHPAFRCRIYFKQGSTHSTRIGAVFSPGPTGSSSWIQIEKLSLKVLFTFRESIKMRRSVFCIRFIYLMRCCLYLIWCIL